MRLFLVLATVLSVAVAGGPPRNKIRRGGPPFYQHGPPPPRSHYVHSAPLGHGHGHQIHGHNGHGHGGISHSNYGYIAGGEAVGGHRHGQYHHQVLGGGSGPHLNSLAQAYSPVEPPQVSVAPIIPYEPQVELPGPIPLQGPGPEHGPGPATTTISKSVYVFSAPQDPSDHIRQHIVKKFPQPKQKHYQVLFINAPNPPPHPQHTVELPQPPELKTQIYVLVKKPQHAPPVKIIPAKVPVHKPEVYFIRYKNNQDGGITPVPSDAPFSYPQHPQLLAADYGVGGHPQLLTDHGHPHPQQLIYQDNTQPLLHVQQEQEQFQPLLQQGYETPYESPQEYNSLVPVQEQQQEQQVEYHPQQQFSPEEYSVSPDAQQYVSADGQQYASPENPGEYQADPYSDHSRLSAHYSTATGRPVTLLSSRSLNKKGKFIKKLRIRKKLTSRSDQWTPIFPNKSMEKRELDAGMSGI